MSKYNTPKTQREGLFNIKQDPVPADFSIIHVEWDRRLAWVKAFEAQKIPFLPVIDGYTWVSKKQGCKRNPVGIIIHNSFLPNLNEFMPQK